MSESDETVIAHQTPIMLELINKQRAEKQARAINRSLTRLKTISNYPAAATGRNAETTGQFVTVQIGDIKAEQIEEAYTAAGKACESSSHDLAVEKKRKKWFKWG